MSLPRGWLHLAFWHEYIFAPYDCLWFPGVGWKSLKSWPAWSKSCGWSWPGWRVIWCRMKGHPNGEVYYCSGLEPDSRCRDCGEHLY
jgi:hypothetical protein